MKNTGSPLNPTRSDESDGKSGCSRITGQLLDRIEAALRSREGYRMGIEALISLREQLALAESFRVNAEHALKLDHAEQIASLTTQRDTAQALATVREIEADRVTAERDKLARMAQPKPESDANPTLRKHREGLAGTVKGEFPDSPADPKAAE